MPDWQNFDNDELIALAYADIDERRHDLALDKLKQVLAREYPPAEAISLTAKLYAMLRLFDRAHLLFERYLALHPEALEENFQLGMVLYDKGDVDKAFAIWEALLKREPVFPPGLYFCAVVQKQKGRLAEARRNLDVLLKTAQPDNQYVERARELLQAIDRSARSAAGATVGGSAKAVKDFPG